MTNQPLPPKVVSGRAARGTLNFSWGLLLAMPEDQPFQWIGGLPKPILALFVFAVLYLLGYGH